MGVSNPVEAAIGMMMLIDEVRTKMEGTRLAQYPWRPVSPDAADDLIDLASEALARCDDATEALIVFTAAAVIVAGLRNPTDLR